MFGANSATTGIRVIVGLVILTVIAGMGVCYIQYQGMTKTHDELVKRTKVVGDETSVKAKLTATQAALLTAETQVRFLEKSVTDSWYVPTLLKQLEASAKSVNLELMSVRPNTVKKIVKATTDADKKDKSKEAEVKEVPKPYQELDIQISVTGKFWDVMRFLKGLKTFPKILSVQQVQIMSQASLNSPDASKNLLDVQMTVRAFVFTQKTTSTATTTSTPVKGGS
jgi:Tfp pilus assembly protein PilO